VKSQIASSQLKLEVRAGGVCDSNHWNITITTLRINGVEISKIGPD
jgi:hypothetical protein